MTNRKRNSPRTSPRWDKARVDPAPSPSSVPRRRLRPRCLPRRRSCRLRAAPLPSPRPPRTRSPSSRGCSTSCGGTSSGPSSWLRNLGGGEDSGSPDLLLWNILAAGADQTPAPVPPTNNRHILHLDWVGGFFSSSSQDVMCIKCMYKILQILCCLYYVK